MSHPSFQVCLLEPKIPQNTGNIGRLCVGLGARLLILGTPAFDLSDKARRRAGLDYWEHLEWEHQSDAEAWVPPKRVFALTKFATETIWETSFEPGDTFLFGSETTGLPDSWRERFPGIRIPMVGPVRSFNLANAVAMTLSEATRQTREGRL